MASRILAGRYELSDRIGEGGMAVVFKAKDRFLNRFVAIKILRPEYTNDSVFIESFKRESQIAAGLIHPNIVSIYDVGKQGNIYYIVMELIDGKPLSNIIREQGPLDPQWAAEIAKEVASALSLAHKNQLIHRDIKPHNIMMTKEGVAKITDFGIAKAVSKDTFVGEQKSSVMGSVHYFSPEQARGKYVDERSDIYSLGIVLFEMLTGKVPFDGETAVEVAVKHMNEEMIKPSVLRPDIPSDMEDIILKATDKLQVNRYKNADELITALALVRFQRKSESTGVSAKEALQDKETASKPILQKQEEEDLEEEYNQTITQEELDEEERTRLAAAKKKTEKLPLIKRKWFQRVLACCLALIFAIPASKIFYDKLSTKNKTTKVTTSTVVSEASKSEKKETSSGIPSELTVPNLQNKNFDEMKNALAQQGVNLEKEMELTSKEYAEGYIMSQTPTAGTTMKSGQTIRVTVSKGEAKSLVPALVSKSYAGAKLIIESYGFKLGTVSYSYSKDYRENSVISQSPEEGSELKEGNSINLVVSMGEEPEKTADVRSIDVLGLEYEKAIEKIAELGFVLGSTTKTFNMSVPENCVISQDPGNTEALEEGTAINLVISLGQETPQETPQEPVVNPEIPVETPQPPTETPTETPQPPAETPAETPQQPTETPAETPQQPVVTPTEPSQQPAETPVETPQQQPETVSKTISLPLDFSKAKEDVFFLTVTVSSNGNSTTIINNQQMNKADGSTVVDVSGTGADGRVVVLYSNEIVYNYKVNFETGAYN